MILGKNILKILYSKNIIFKKYFLDRACYHREGRIPEAEGAKLLRTAFFMRTPFRRFK